MNTQTKTFTLWNNQNKEKVTVEAKKVGQEWKAFCPFHDDRTTPNLSINEDKSVYYCHACGAKGSLYKEEFSHAPGQKKTIIKEFNYKDESGKLIYQVVRFHPKGFAQRKANGEWNLKGIKPILYNLPELAIKSDKLIFIVEGEKDVESLKAMGLLATTSPMGVGKWKSEYNQWFKNRNVIVIPDNDKPGMDHANEIIKALKPVVKSIKRLELPGLKEKEDVSDWVNNGGDLEQLHKIMLDTPEIDLTKEEKPKENKKNNKDKKEKTRTLIPGLIHLVKIGEQAYYLLQNDHGLYIEETYTGEDGTICKPKSDLPIHYCGTDILKESREVNYSSLLEDIIEFIKRYLELPEESSYLVLALWVFHTYLIDKFDTTPIIYFQGVKETGKTRAGEILGELAYRCERLTSPTEATLFRSAEYFKTTLVVDELQLWGKEGNQAVGRLIKSRYKRGLKVSRINQYKSGEDEVEYFDVFAPLVISTTEMVPDIIESRCIKFLMQKNKNSNVEKLIDKELARKLSNKLTIFRANLIDQQLPEVEPVARRRLNEILNPIYQILMQVDPNREEEFKLTVQGLEQYKDTEEEFTLEAEIVEAVAEYYNEQEETEFSTADIVSILNQDRSQKDELKSRTIGRGLANLGFKKKKYHGRKRGFNFDIEFLKGLINQYRVKNIEPKENKLFDN